MGWVNEDWRAAVKASIAHEAKLISAFPVDPDQPAEADDSDED
jgi:hypothetical protein